MVTEGQAVRFRDCTCPGTPHDGKDGADDGDIVYLRPALGFAAGAEALRKMGEAVIVLAPTGGGEDGAQPLLDLTRTAELVSPVYIRHGVESWNLVDEKGPVPLDVDAILDNYTWSYPIAERADELYSEAVISPLLTRTTARLKNGQNGAPTRLPSRSSKTPRSPRKSSSRNGSAGLPSATNR